jgi:hypothetical protein
MVQGKRGAKSCIASIEMSIQMVSIMRADDRDHHLFDAPRP